MRGTFSSLIAASTTVVIISITGPLLTLGAQGAGPTSAIMRLREMGSRGDSVSAHTLADSIVSATGTSTVELAEALYWKGVLTANPDSSRTILSRVVVEYDLTPAAGDALYRLAQLDFRAGDRAGAIRRLSKVNSDYGMSVKAVDAGFELSQLQFVAGNLRDGCAALDSALVRLSADQVERRNRMSYARRPCLQLGTEPVTSDSAKSEPVLSNRQTTPVTDTVRSAAPAPARPARGAVQAAPVRGWSVQVGAYAVRADAERLSARLGAKGYESRVTKERPYRVRVGRFASRAEATTMVNKLKAEKTAAILVEAERP